ncbi:MAG: Gfo/Idh/MocA family oxidoreductase [Armatimonadota bacterium]|nr:Gfo/Idh/MocA family oxidoreductase [Armatimonadota bacterium]
MRIALVGAGNFGRLHAAVLADLPGAALVAVCDPDPAARRLARAAMASASMGTGPRAAAAAPAGAEVVAAGRDDALQEFDSFDAVLARADVDAVVLATPEHLHAAQAIAATERGWDVLVEKPLALTAADARAVAAAAARTGRLVMVGTVLRFSLPHRQLVEAVHAGAVGRVRHVRSARYVSASWFARTAVHPALRAAIHDIDLVLWLTGRRVRAVAAAAHALAGETRPRAVVALLWLDDGASAVVEAHFVVPPSYPATTLPPERPGVRAGLVEVVGEVGLARLDDSAGLQLWGEGGAYAPDLHVVPRVASRPVGALRAEVEHFVASVAARAPSTMVPLDDAVHAVAVAEAIAAAADSGGVVSVDT